MDRTGGSPGPPRRCPASPGGRRSIVCSTAAGDRRASCPRPGRSRAGAIIISSTPGSSPAAMCRAARPRSPGPARCSRRTPGTASSRRCRPPAPTGVAARGGARPGTPTGGRRRRPGRGDGVRPGHREPGAWGSDSNGYCRRTHGRAANRYTERNYTMTLPAPRCLRVAEAQPRSCYIGSPINNPYFFIFL
jgi:hypothetical protein